MTASRGLLQPTEVSRTRAQRLEDVVGAELETVLYAQMLALFAPHAVRVARHLPLLLATLTSRQPALRRAAAATLRHFAERHASPYASSALPLGTPPSVPDRPWSCGMQDGKEVAARDRMALILLMVRASGDGFMGQAARMCARHCAPCLCRGLRQHLCAISGIRRRSCPKRSRARC